MDPEELKALYGDAPIAPETLKELQSSPVREVQAYSPEPVSPPMALIGGAPSSAEVDAMKNVLEALNSTGSSVATKIVTESVADPDLSDIYNTAFSNSDSVKIGNVFEVKVRKIDSLRGKKKVYDIYNSATGETITNDLFLYEAAYAIVKYLNKGYNVLSSEIRQIAKLEQDYAAARTDAGIFRTRHSENVKSGNNRKAQLYETRFYDSKDKALRIKSELIKIAERL